MSCCSTHGCDKKGDPLGEQLEGLVEAALIATALHEKQTALLKAALEGNEASEAKIQEQSTEIGQLKAKIQEQSTEIGQLKATIQKLEARLQSFRGAVEHERPTVAARESKRVKLGHGREHEEKLEEEPQQEPQQEPPKKPQLKTHGTTLVLRIDLTDLPESDQQTMEIFLRVQALKTNGTFSREVECLAALAPSATDTTYLETELNSLQPLTQYCVSYCDADGRPVCLSASTGAPDFEGEFYCDWRLNGKYANVLWVIPEDELGQQSDNRTVPVKVVSYFADGDLYAHEYLHFDVLSDKRLPGKVCLVARDLQRPRIYEFEYRGLTIDDIVVPQRSPDLSVELDGDSVTLKLDMCLFSTYYLRTSPNGCDFQLQEVEICGGVGRAVVDPTVTHFQLAMGHDVVSNMVIVERNPEPHLVNVPSAKAGNITTDAQKEMLNTKVQEMYANLPVPEKEAPRGEDPLYKRCIKTVLHLLFKNAKNFKITPDIKPPCKKRDSALRLLKCELEADLPPSWNNFPVSDLQVLAGIISGCEKCDNHIFEIQITVSAPESTEGMRLRVTDLFEVFFGPKTRGWKALDIVH